MNPMTMSPAERQWMKQRLIAMGAAPQDGLDQDLTGLEQAVGIGRAPAAVAPAHQPTQPSVQPVVENVMQTASPGTKTLPYQEESDKTVTTEKSSTPTVLPKSMFDQLVAYADQLKDQDLEGIRKGLIRKQMDTIDQFAQTGGQADLSPIMGLGDILTDGRYGLQKGYKPPSLEDDRDYLKFKMQSGVLDDLSKGENYAQLLKLMIGKDENVTQKTEASKEGTKTAPPPKASSGKPGANYGKWIGQIQANPEGKALVKSITEGQKALTLLRNASPAGDMSFVTSYIKSLGDDRLSNQDKADARKALGSLGDRFEQLWSEMTTGTMSPDRRRDYTKVIKEIQKVMRKKHGEIVERAKGIGRGYGDISEDQLTKGTTGIFGEAPVEEKSQFQLLMEKKLQEKAKK